MADNNHYQTVAKEYESAFFYASGPYQDHLLSTVLAHLRLDAPGPDSRGPLRLADVGGGTGNFTVALAQAAGLTSPVLCVDNSADMLAVAATRPGLVPICQDALSFAQRTPLPGEALDRVLLKEIVHHLPVADLPALYKGLGRQLAPGGLLLTVTRPQEVDYPLFEAARRVWRANQPAAEVFESACTAAGLSVVRSEAVYTATLPKERWFAMVRSRFWSTFSAMTDEELEAGIQELEAQHAGVTLTFRDRLILITASKFG
jgi:ubiquinone/menaquinone biosynthesis C-methylase UbiE